MLDAISTIVLAFLLAGLVVCMLNLFRHWVWSVQIRGERRMAERAARREGL